MKRDEWMVEFVFLGGTGQSEDILSLSGELWRGRG